MTFIRGPRGEIGRHKGLKIFFWWLIKNLQRPTAHQNSSKQ